MHLSRLTYSAPLLHGGGSEPGPGLQDLLPAVAMQEDADGSGTGGDLHDKGTNGLQRNGECGNINFELFVISCGAGCVTYSLVVTSCMSYHFTR